MAAEGMKTKQYVTFRVEDHLLGLDVLRVREINRVLEITPVPRAPEYVRGLVNLRGQILTVFDLGVRLGLGPRQIGPETHNVILKEGEVGLLVDAIGDVAQAGADEMEPPPANIGGIGAEFIDGVVKLENELLVVLTTQALLKFQPGSRDDASGV
jgi:purine-binding chemotaxis protein CheW